jgi:hypothetical protein
MTDHSLMKRDRRDGSALSELPQRKVLVEGRKFQLTRTGSRRFRTVRFVAGGEKYQANAEKPSRWGQLARQGHGVVQFRDLQTQKRVAAVVDGVMHAYGRNEGFPDRVNGWNSRAELFSF